MSNQRNQLPFHPEAKPSINLPLGIMHANYTPECKHRIVSCIRLLLDLTFQTDQ